MGSSECVLVVGDVTIHGYCTLGKQTLKPVDYSTLKSHALTSTIMNTVPEFELQEGLCQTPFQCKDVQPE